MRIIITLITLIVAVVGAAVAATWRMSRMTAGLEQSVGGLQQSVADSVGQRIDQTRNELRDDIAAVGRRVDRVLEAQAAQGGDSEP